MYKPKKNIVLFSISIWLLLTIFNQESKAVDYQVEIKDIKISQEEKQNISQEPPPTVLSSSIEKTLGLSLIYENYFVKFKPNSPALLKIKLIPITGKNQNYSLTISEDTKGSENNIIKKLPQFSGDSGDCPSLFRACTWVVKSTYGLAFRLENSLFPDFTKPDTYKRLPDLYAKELPITIINNELKSDLTDLDFTYKINYPKEVFNYKIEKTITYTLIPTY